MAILIKGVKMPAYCYECPLCYDNLCCMALNESFKDADGDLDFKRKDNCPLIEVTE